MDVMDFMDIVDISNPLRRNDYSPLLDDRNEMEPNNLSQSVATIAETDTTGTEETEPAVQSFTERNLELKLPILSSSSSESESEEVANAAAGTSIGAESERAASPPPNCAICLGRCKNKCFTDSCMHQFCFKCLCEWSKVKPECPLCKQTFKSIIHNVKSIHQFEEYHVQPPTVQIAHTPFEMNIFDVMYPRHNRIQAWNGSAYRPYYFEASGYSPASNAGSLPTASGSNSNRAITPSENGAGLRNQYVYRGELLDLYRHEFPGGIANGGTLSQLWRRYVYDRKLYAMPVADITGRFRECNARFYRDNPSQIHRLMPWINRDIVCLLRQTQHDVTNVLESINSALTIMNILSPAFRRRLQPFLSTKTGHFIHELNNFARSPYDMIGYDRAVQYSPQTNNEEIVIEFTSSDESTDIDQIDVSGDVGNNNPPRNRPTNASSINNGIFELSAVQSAINLTIHNRLTSSSVNVAGNRTAGNNDNNISDIQDDVSLVIDLRGESDNNETVSVAQAINNSSNYLNNQNVSMSENDMINSNTHPAVSENIELTSGSSDECEFVLERKPPHLRTPEMVSLDSASDSDVVFIDEIPQINKSSFSTSEGELNEDVGDRNRGVRHHNKIAALVEAKKRNQSSSFVKTENKDRHRELYNLGASTSAALRLSLQKLVDKSHRSNGSSGSKRLRRKKYCLRNSDSQLRTERNIPKRRDRHLYSESSHSSTSSTTTNSSTCSKTSTSQSSTSSSDEDYDAPKSSRSVRKTKTRKTSRKKKNSRVAKCDSRKQKNNDYSSNQEEDDHLDKNFELTMAIKERRKRQQKEQEENDEENSWRSKAVDEPLRRQQQQQAKSSHKSNERKRRRKPSTQHEQQLLEKRNNRKLGKYENQASYKQDGSENTSSDESDNINLIQLKTKLAAQDCRKELIMGQTNINQVAEALTTNPNYSENNINASATNTVTSTTISITTTESTTIPTRDITAAAEILRNMSTANDRSEDAIVSVTHETSNNVADEVTSQNDLFNFSDDTNETIQNDNEVSHIDNNNNDNVDQQNIRISSSNHYYDNNQDISTHANSDNVNQNDDTAADDENFHNIPSTTNQNEANAFDDGTSMTTTTTDTILHEAAEQISSAAVNFYDFQPTFNTAYFAGENSNSSTSDSSISSSTTSVSSSSNSSSTNTNSW